MLAQQLEALQNSENPFSIPLEFTWHIIHSRKIDIPKLKEIRRKLLRKVVDFKKQGFAVRELLTFLQHYVNLENSDNLLKFAKDLELDFNQESMEILQKVEKAYVKGHVSKVVWDYKFRNQLDDYIQKHTAKVFKEMQAEMQAAAKAEMQAAVKAEQRKQKAAAKRKETATIKKLAKKGFDEAEIADLILADIETVKNVLKKKR